MNKIILYSIQNCGELLDIKKINEKTISINNIEVGNRFQFDDDRNRVREILAIDGEYLLVKTIGCADDLPFYKCHYSQLKKNETQIEEYK